MNARDVVRPYDVKWRIETWYLEVKQNFGLSDCNSSRFNARESYVGFRLTA